MTLMREVAALDLDIRLELDNFQGNTVLIKKYILCVYYVQVSCLIKHHAPNEKITIYNTHKHSFKVFYGLLKTM